MQIRLKGHAMTRAVHLNGWPLDPRKSMAYWNHSPDGFNWGYNGSGPAQLALAVCLEIYGKPRNGQPFYYQEFKRRYIANLPMGKDFDITFDVPDKLEELA